MTDRPPALSESIQMYLVHILRLGRDEQLVPLSQLAAALGVSPISVNQMCRRLNDEGLVEYTPYKGVALTSTGRELAARVLRRHRLWEVFLVGHLHLRWEEAHDTACLLEHDTPDPVVERLAAFLHHPRVNPEGEPIPDAAGTLSTLPAQNLTELEVGQKGYYLRCTADEASCAFLLGQGLRPGARIQVLAGGPQSMLVEVSGRKVTLGRSLADTVQVEAEQ
jgi:DtxR family Mn-dependent transcriptional regulator